MRFRFIVYVGLIAASSAACRTTSKSSELNAGPAVGLPVQPYEPAVGLPVQPYEPTVGLPVYPGDPAVGLPVQPEDDLIDVCAGSVKSSIIKTLKYVRIKVYFDYATIHRTDNDYIEYNDSLILVDRGHNSKLRFEEKANGRRDQWRSRFDYTGYGRTGKLEIFNSYTNTRETLSGIICGPNAPLDPPVVYVPYNERRR